MNDQILDVDRIFAGFNAEKGYGNVATVVNPALSRKPAQIIDPRWLWFELISESGAARFSRTLGNRSVPCRNLHLRRRELCARSRGRPRRSKRRGDVQVQHNWPCQGPRQQLSSQRTSRSRDRYIERLPNWPIAYGQSMITTGSVSTSERTYPREISICRLAQQSRVMLRRLAQVAGLTEICSWWGTFLDERSYAGRVRKHTENPDQRCSPVITGPKKAGRSLRYRTQ